MTKNVPPPPDNPALQNWLRTILAVLAFAATLGVLALACVYVTSEAVIQRRYPLASTTAHAKLTEKLIRRGGHLVTVGGCTDCHGSDLEGRLMHAETPLPVYADNLLRAAQTMSDGELERAMRYAIRPDATSMWVMPAGNYTYMSEDDVAAIISYLRSLPPAGVVHPPPQFGFAARLALLRGTVRPALLVAVDDPASLDLGPRYDGGRYLARITCGECHGTDLKGQGAAPDLARVALYSRPAFFSLLRRGLGSDGRMLPAMHRLARVRFRAFADYEIMALYDYLDARAHAPADVVARAEALRRHEENQRRLSETPQ